MQIQESRWRRPQLLRGKQLERFFQTIQIIKYLADLCILVDPADHAVVQCVGGGGSFHNRA